MCETLLGMETPKICIPIVESTQEKIFEAAKKLSTSVADLVEWRADYYEDLEDLEKIQETITKLGQILGDKALLFTIRTCAEGGETEISFERYAEILQTVAVDPEIDYIDVEMFCGDRERMEAWSDSYHECHRPVCDLVQSLKKDVAVIGSYHDFVKTPEAEEIAKRLLVMYELGADIPKMAVMPNSKADVLTLMEATLMAKQILKGIPVITMSMGAMGVVSRVAGESFGSSVTFGCLGNPSAPGQLEANQLKQILEILHEVSETTYI